MTKSSLDHFSPAASFVNRGQWPRTHLGGIVYMVKPLCVEHDGISDVASFPTDNEGRWGRGQSNGPKFRRSRYCRRNPDAMGPLRNVPLKRLGGVNEQQTQE